jgi:hypothetical protein
MLALPLDIEQRAARLDRFHGRSSSWSAVFYVMRR